jgi:hypothetical protein
MHPSLETRPRLLAFGCLLAGLVAAYYVCASAHEARRLRADLLKAQMELAALRSAASKAATADPSAATPFTTPSWGQVWTNIHGQTLTEDDRQISLALNERRKKGEYILKFERPLDRKVMEAGIKQLASRIASNRAPALDAVFSQLALNPEISKQLKDHQEKIALASLQTETAMQQLILARQAYDTRMHSILSPDEYSSYRQFEDSGGATREYAALQQFADQKNTPLDPAYQQQVMDLIRSSQAYTSESWHGPYDSWPQIAIGQDMVVQKIEQEIGQISQAASTLREQATQASLPAPYVDLLSSYFADRISARNRTLENLNRPPGPPGNQ